MKKIMMSLVLLGGILLAANLTLAQDAPPASGNDSITTNQVDNSVNAQTNAASDSGNSY